MEAFKIEFGILEDRLPHHPNILKIYMHFMDIASKDTLPEWKTNFNDRTIFVVRPYITSTLNDIIQKNILSKYQNVVIFSQLIAIVDHINSNMIVHRDITPDNLILTERSNGIYHVELSGFGYCLDFKEERLKTLNKKIILQGMQVAYSKIDFCKGGNIQYLPPEILKASLFGKNLILDYSKSDLFSIGIIAYKLFASHDSWPFRSKFGTTVISDETYIPIPNCSRPINDIIRSMLRPYVNDRCDLRIAKSLFEKVVKRETLIYNAQTIRGELKGYLLLETGQCIDISPDGKQLISAGNRRLLFYDLNSDSVSYTRHLELDLTPKIVCYSPNGVCIALDNGSEIRIHDKITDKLVNTFRGHNLKILAMKFSHKGDIIASSSCDKTVKLWRMGVEDKPYDISDYDAEPIIDDHLVHTFKIHKGGVNCICFDSQDRLILTASDDASVGLYDITKEKLVRRFKGHRYYVYTVAISPRGNEFCSGSLDKTIKLWDMRSSSPIQTQKKHTASVNSLCYSPCGNFILSGSLDKTVRMWDASLIENRKTMKCSGCVNRVTFSKDASRIIVAVRAQQQFAVDIWK